MINEELYKNIKKILCNYNELLNNIEFINSEIEIVKNEYKGCSGLEYGEKVSATNKFSSSVENELINKDKELKNLNAKLNKNIRLKCIIDNAIRSLRNPDKKVIELRYLNKEKLTWRQIGNIVKFSADHCRQKINSRAIKKIISILNENDIDINRYI